MAFLIASSVEAPPEAVTGLDVQGNASASDPMLLWNTAITGKAPLAPFSATYILKAFPRAQTSYWSYFFWYGNYPGFVESDLYYGCHPYPDFGTGGTASLDEISVDGEDVTGLSVPYNTWRTHVVTVTAGRLVTYYPNWPDTGYSITHTIDSGKSVPGPNPSLMMLSNPWAAGLENPNAILRGFQFYDAALSTTDIASELTTPGSVRTPWYLKLNPTPTDVADDSGNGNDPAWVGSDRPLLWEEA